MHQLQTSVRRRATAMPKLQFIVGPTGIGKSALATAEARRTGAPVVVLDRIQCYSEIAIGSGRPQSSEIAGTTRIYLTECGIGEGELTAEKGIRYFVDVLSAAARAGHDLIIVEGGSVTLSRLWSNIGLPWQGSMQVLEIKDKTSYALRVRKRVREMVLPGYGGSDSMIDEFSHAWRRYEAQRDFLTSIIGFDVIAQWCEKAGVLPGELSSRQLRPEQVSQLVTEITNSHCSYAQEQSAFFAGIRHAGHLSEGWGHAA